MNATTEYPISAAKAVTIRSGFADMADEMRPKVAALRATGDDAMADMLAKQVASWDFMAARQYESMQIVGDI